MIILCYFRPDENFSSMTDILHTNIFLEQTVCTMVRISLKLVPAGQIDNN